MPLAWGDGGGGEGQAGLGLWGTACFWSGVFPPHHHMEWGWIQPRLVGGGGEQVTPSHLPQLSLLFSSCPYPFRLPTPPRTPLYL